MGWTATDGTRLWLAGVATLLGGCEDARDAEDRAAIPILSRDRNPASDSAAPPSRFRPGHVQLLGAQRSPARALPQPEPAAPPEPSPEQLQRTAVIERLRAMIRAQSQHERARPLDDLGFSWDRAGDAVAEGLGHRWALYFADGQGAWTAKRPPGTGAAAGWCCMVWPIARGPRSRAWFANDAGGVWEAAAPRAVFDPAWRPDPGIVAPRPRGRASYLRQASAAGFVWAELPG